MARGEEKRRIGKEERRRGGEEQRWQDVGRSVGKMGRDRESQLLAAPQRAAPLHPALLHNSLAWQPNMGFVCMGLWATLYCRKDTGDTRKMGRCDHIVCDTPFLLFIRFSSFIQTQSSIITCRCSVLMNIRGKWTSKSTMAHSKWFCHTSPSNLPPSPIPLSLV